MFPSGKPVSDYYLSHVYMTCSLTCRADSFRKAYVRIGEIRSIVHREVNVMALTATATRHTRMDVIKKLGMKNCAVVSCSPHKPNITLEVKEKSDLSTVLTPLVDDLLANGVSATGMLG